VLFQGIPELLLEVFWVLIKDFTCCVKYLSEGKVHHPSWVEAFGESVEEHRTVLWVKTISE